MKIINHGSWSRYTPRTVPRDVPAGVMFCRRDGDGVDWYDYIHGDGAKLAGGSVKMTVLEGTVRAVNRDATALFPQGCVVLELIGDVSPNPQAAFGGKFYDARTNALVDPPPARVEPSLTDLIARIEALERR
jgi:hypothetical protein